MTEFTQIEEESALWQWESTLADHTVAQCFQDKLAHTEKLLQEKISIDRRAAKFFHSATGTTQSNHTVQDRQRLLLRSDVFLDERNFPDEALWAPASDHDETVARWCPWNCENDDWMVPQEARFLPRDTLSVSKEVAPFIRSCIKCIYTQSKQNRLTDASPLSAFIITPSLIKEVDDESVIHKNFFQVPELIHVSKDSDEDYIQETVGPEETGETILTSVPQLDTLMTLLGEYTIALKDPPEITDINYQIVYEPWNIPQTPSNYYNQARSLEDYLVDENINKGAMFLLNSPFMSDQPTFQEYQTPFDYTISRLPAVIKFEVKTAMEFFAMTKRFNERDLIEETISFEEFENKPAAARVIQKIISTEMHWIEGNASIPTRAVQSKVPTPTTRLDTSIPSLTYMQDTAIQIDETAKARVDTSDTTIGNEEEHSSIAATKMVTQTEVFPNPLPPKRSIDYELEDLISLKRKKALGSENTSRKPILDLLRASSTFAETTINDGVTTTHVKDSQIDDRIKSFREPKLNCTCTIGFNSSHTRKFQKNISYLSNCTSLQVIELDLDPLDVEFLISSQCAVMIVDVSLLDQCVPTGDLVIQERLTRNMKVFDHLIVLVLADHIVKRETVAAFQLTLAILGIEAIVVEKSHETVCDWICEAAYTYGKQWSSEQMAILEGDEYMFLTESGLDPFTAVEVLQLMPLLEFVSLSSRQRSHIPCLTMHQCNVMDGLLNQEWIINSNLGNASREF